MYINITSVKTGEILTTVTTKSSSVCALFSNVNKWMKRHKQYIYVCADELKNYNLEYSNKIYWVKEI